MDNADKNGRQCEYLSLVADLLSHAEVRRMKQFRQHADCNCYMHCLQVSYYSYYWAKRLGWDYRSAARGALLHDLFLYDWHEKRPGKNWHGFTHARTALDNAAGLFELNEMEQDIIAKHMFPLGVQPPRYAESFLVNLLDKFCAGMEVLRLHRAQQYKLLQTLPLYVR